MVRVGRRSPGGEGGEPGVDGVVVVVVGGILVEVGAAGLAEAAAVGSTEGMDRLGQRDRLADRFAEVEFVVLVEPQGVRLGGEIERGAGEQVDGG